MIGVAHCNKLAVCWQLKDKKNFLLTINNYLLKHNGVTIYIYIWTLCHFLLYLRDRQIRYLVGAVILCYTIFRRVRLLLERLSLERDFFPYSPVFCIDIVYLLFSNPKDIYFHRGFLWEQTFLIG